MSIREKKAEGQFCFPLMLALFVVLFRLQCRTRGDKWHPLGCLPLPHLPDKGVYGALCGLMHVTAAHLARSYGGHQAPAGRNSGEETVEKKKERRKKPL